MAMREEIQQLDDQNEDDVIDEFSAIKHHKKRAFLVAYCEYPSITKACKIAGISNVTFYAWLKKDADFKAAYEQAYQIGGDKIEDVAKHRAIKGRREQVFGNLGENKGTGVVGYRRVVSDSLMALILKAHKPEKYRERTEHTGPAGGPLKVEISRQIVEVPEGNDID